MIKPLSFSLLFALLVSACSLLPDKIDETKDWSAQKFYLEASEAMADSRYERAIELYQALEARFPFGPQATQAQLDVAYAHYRNNEPEAAIAAANRFIRLHPRHEYVDYAYYLKGIVNFNRNVGFITRFVPTDISQRDPGTALESFKDFAALVERFPDSRYSADARKRLVYLRNNLAMYQIHVARYYMKRGAYLAAANRAKTVVEGYQRTPAMKEALVILSRAYEELDMPMLAQDAQRVLALNEDRGTFDLPEYDEATLGEAVWDFLELDRN